MTSYLSLWNLDMLPLPFQRLKHSELWILSVTIKDFCFHYVECWMYISTTYLRGCFMNKF